jgi:hypothetical protein
MVLLTQRKGASALSDKASQINSFAFEIANEAIYDFRLNKLPIDSETYKAISAKIDWYVALTSKELK